MPIFYDVVVAQYGHPSLRGAKHWAIVVMTGSGTNIGVVYQIDGSTTTYAVKQPKTIELLSSKTYMGKVNVGQIHTDWAFAPQSMGLDIIVRNTPVIRGDPQWNCQNWVVTALERLRAAGHGIRQVTVASLGDALAQAEREDL